MDEEEGFRPYKPPPPSPGRFMWIFSSVSVFHIISTFIKHILYTCHEFRRVEYVGKEEKAC